MIYRQGTYKVLFILLQEERWRLDAYQNQVSSESIFTTDDDKGKNDDETTEPDDVSSTGSSEAISDNVSPFVKVTRDR